MYFRISFYFPGIKKPLFIMYRNLSNTDVIEKIHSKGKNNTEEFLIISYFKNNLLRRIQTSESKITNFKIKFLSHTDSNPFRHWILKRLKANSSFPTSFKDLDTFTFNIQTLWELLLYSPLYVNWLISSQGSYT